VSGGVLTQLPFVVARGHDLPIPHHHRANRHVLVFQRSLGLLQGQAHEVVVPWEEAFAHSSRRGLCDSASWADPGPSSLPKPSGPPAPAVPPPARALAARCSSSPAPRAPSARSPRAPPQWPP